MVLVVRDKPEQFVARCLGGTADVPALRVVQQAREEDLERVVEAYSEASISAEVAPFFADLPERIANAHLVM